MLIPYSTDAPIYHFPWMTIALIVINGVTFSMTSMGSESDGWLLTYGRGLHPLEWVAYNFLHFDLIHLVGNMFFLWAFGIVVEGKLGWWKFLILYLSIGVFGGIVIQSAMLGYVPDDSLGEIQAGGGGASLIIYGLMAIVLIWAPRNEIHCLWVGFRSGAFEIEYLYFCGFYIVTEVLSAIWSIRGFEITSEIGHATGVLVGLGLGTLLVKQAWVDCENWDLFSIMNGKHDAAMHVGGWQDNIVVHSSRKRNRKTEAGVNSTVDFDQPNVKQKRKKSKPKPRLVELESFDDPFDTAIDGPLPEQTQESATEYFPPMMTPNSDVSADSREERLCPKKASDPLEGVVSPLRSDAPRGSAPFFGQSRKEPTDQVREYLDKSEFEAALNEYQELLEFDSQLLLPKDDLRKLADGLVKCKESKAAAPLLEEYIHRFKDADRQRVKLALIYVKTLGRFAAALKVLEKVDVDQLSDDYHSAYLKIVQEAKRSVELGDGLPQQSREEGRK